MSYLTQALALGVQNFVSAAAGIAVVVALIRGFARAEKGTIGNFWVDLTRTTLYILLPLSLVYALLLVSQGVVQTLHAYPVAELVEPLRTSDTTSRHAADHRGGPGGKPDRHQAAGHERRRVLQRQLGASVREPDSHLEFPGDAGHPADPRGALRDVRPDGAGPAAGLGHSRGHDGHSRSARHRRDRARAARHTGACRGRCRPGGLAAAGRRQHGGQGDPLRHRQLRASGPRRRPRRPTARSTRCTTASRRLAASFRCG